MNPDPSRMVRSILHIDMDAFFASVEVLDNPGLRGKPVIVGGTPEGRGVVAAASYEARRYGVHSAMSAWRALKLCPQAIVIAPRGRRYGEVSRQVFAIFRAYTPLVEAISIDEAFLDVTASEKLFGPAEQIGREIKRRIREEVGLTASVGLAPNKFLAKLASDLEKPDGFVVIRPGEAEARLGPLPVGKIWGIGKVAEKHLNEMGIMLVRDLLACPREILEQGLGAAAIDLLKLARGEDDRPVVPESDAKSIGNENTFATDIEDAGALRAELDRLVEKSARRLRAQRLTARTVQIKARFPDFTTVTRAVTLARATDATPTLRDAARELLEQRLGRAGRPLRLLGVSFSGLEHAGEGQAELFADGNEERAQKIDAILDRLRNHYGDHAIGRGTVAAQGDPPPKPRNPGKRSG